MDIKLESSFTLNNNVKIPTLGLGVFQNGPGSSTKEAVLTALNFGYRHIDTAMIYGNEDDVGAAIAASSVPRESIFVTTKLWNSDQGYQATLAALDNSLSELKMDYVDLYLMHWPVENLRLESWQAMEKLLNEGKCRAIGVSNFMVHHLIELLEASETMPAVNQIELSPFNYLYRRDTVNLCRANDICVEAYSPLTKGMRLDDKNLLTIGEKYGKTTAQILIRWALEHQFVVIPKSANEHRIVENASIFDFSISAEDLEFLDELNENLITSWDPTNAP